MRCHVAFTPAEAAAAPLGIVVDLMRATSTIAQALASGYRRVLCCGEIDEARGLRAELGDEAITGGEREARRIEGFDAGASPREFLEPRAETLILSTTNEIQRPGELAHSRHAPGSAGGGSPGRRALPHALHTS